MCAMPMLGNTLAFRVMGGRLCCAICRGGIAICNFLANWPPNFAK
jgi:hypothetical protein